MTNLFQPLHYQIIVKYFDFEIIQVSQIIFTNIIHYSTTILSSLLSIVNNIFQL